MPDPVDAWYCFGHLGRAINLLDAAIQIDSRPLREAAYGDVQETIKLAEKLSIEFPNHPWWGEIADTLKGYMDDYNNRSNEAQ